MRRDELAGSTSGMEAAMLLDARHHQRPVSEKLEAAVIDRTAEGRFEVHPDAYADKDLFDLEMEYIFERTWSFLGIEAQVREPHDFFTTSIGRSPILVTRDKDGALGAFLNICRHKAAILCREEEGRAKVHSCLYHHWSYDSSGKNLAMKDKTLGCYPEAFEKGDHGLIRIARIDTYKGLIFGSLSADVPALGDFLGDMRFFIDLVMDQDKNGMEFIPGRAPYYFNANWKLQLDNGLDPYHVTSAHASLVSLKKKRSSNVDPKTVRTRDWDQHEGGGHHAFNFPNGHAAYVLEAIDPEKQPLYEMLPELTDRFGKDIADAMLNGYQLHIFPNLQIANSAAGIFRKFHPVAVDRTEMQVRCLGGVGEPVARRALRLRQFEDFFNASGLASPDDSVLYEGCQSGFQSARPPYLQGYSRGLSIMVEGANDEARRFGLNPLQSLSSAGRTAAEINLYSPYREWQRMLKAGLEGRPSYE